MNDISVNQQEAPREFPCEPLALVSRDGAAPTTTSRIVAERFGKLHRHVVRDIRKLLADPAIGNFNASNFGLIDYTDSRGRVQQEFLMTKDGFALLAMGFTGSEALRWKVRFLEAFNEMSSQLGARNGALWQQMLAVEARDARSKASASYGSRLMLERKREIPVIVSERTRLEAAIQPALIGGAQ